MKGHDIVVVGASAGGVEALPQLVAGLPQGFPASLFVVQHLSASNESFLPKILQRSGALRAIHPSDKQAIERGVIYVAPPDHHLWLENSHVRVTQGPRINRHRPAVDVLFESAAHAHRERVVGVILTGSMGDGAAGLYTVKRCGGVAIVQDPRDAAVPSMPENALRYVAADHVLPLEQIPAVLEQLADLPPKKSPTKCSEGRFSMDECAERPDLMEKHFGPSTSIICPECGGPLWELRDGKIARFRCLTGHSFSPESLIEAEKVELERALWTATKTLEERAMLLRKLVVDAEQNKRPGAMKALKKRAKDLEAQANTIRNIARKLDPI